MPLHHQSDRPASLKRYRDGTHRVVAPKLTLQRVKPFLPVIGITRIANVTGLDRLGVPVVMVCRPNSRSIAVSQGKGLTLEAAKASGVMEAIETYHAETVHLPLKHAAYDDLRFALPIADISGLPAPADSRYDDGLPLLWIEGRNLLDDHPLWLPFECVHANFALPLPAGSGCFAANTNGLASGNHPLEAICHGIGEVIERDATTLWRLKSDADRAGSAIAIETIDDPASRSVLHRFDAAGVDVRIWETTTDVGVASFLCLAIGRDAEGADPEFGAGCHPNRAIALTRALTEAAQARTTYIVGARDDLGPELYRPAERLRRREACEGLLQGGPAKRSFTDVPSFDADTLEDDRDALLDRLRSVGIREVIAVDLSKPAFGIPVVRICIPGLEGPMEDESGSFLPGPRARAALEAER